jgi:hypothetical protein
VDASGIITTQMGNYSRLENGRSTWDTLNAVKVTNTDKKDSV